MWACSFDPAAARAAAPEAAGVRHAHLPRWPRALRLAAAVPRLQRRLGLALWHGSWVTPPLAPVPAVLALHDVLFATHGALVPAARRLALRALVPAAARAARRVVVPTDATRRALLSSLPGVDARRVVVVPLGVDAGVFRPGPDEGDAARLAAAGAPARPFALFVGRAEGRKGIEDLAAAVAHVRPALDLVLAGPNGRALARRAGARRGRAGPVVVEGPDDATLAALYRACAAACLPSRAEGFGLPLLEALACGAPAVATSDPALVEVAGGAAAHVPAGDVRALARALERAAFDPETRARARALGPARARRFSLEAMAEATVAVYRDALGA